MTENSSIPAEATEAEADNTNFETELVEEPSTKRLKLYESEPSESIPQIQHLDGSRPQIMEDAGTLSEMKVRIKAKEQILYKLKQVESYKKKWSIEDLKNQIDVWKEIGLATFEDLFKKSSEEKESLTKEELLKYLGVDPNVLGVDLNE